MTGRQLYYSFRFSILFCLGLAFPTLAQDISASDALVTEVGDSTVIDSDTLTDKVRVLEGSIDKDTVQNKKFVSGIEIKIDYGKLLLIWTEFESKYEAGLNLRLFERIVLATEFGRAELNPLKAYDNAIFYRVSGVYGRAGMDYYTAYDPGNFYYVGLRYAVSNFEDEGAFLLGSEYWDDYQEGFGSKNVSASWVELILGTETFLKIGKKAKETGRSRLLLGWNGRLRFLTNFENREQLRIYAIPGYGRTFNDMAAALNFYIKYRLGS